MNNMNTDGIAASKQATKKLEKEMEHEAKTDDKRVQKAMKDLSIAEKAEVKVQKSIDKAEKHLDSTHKKEMAAQKALHKAKHQHNIAVANMEGAGKEVELKKQHEQRVQRDLEAKKVKVENSIKDQKLHNDQREIRLAELQTQNSGGSVQPPV